jgi:cytochrome c553
MVREHEPVKTENPWPKIGWRITTALILVSFFLGFVVVGRPPSDDGLGFWAAMCRSLGLTSNTTVAAKTRPPLQTPTRIAWTPETLARVAKGQVSRGGSLAAGCAGCHGQDGVSTNAAYPTLAGMEAVTIYKQLDDFRSGKRSSPIMSAFAGTLTPESSADLAAFFASRRVGLPAPHGGPLVGGHTLREHDVAVRLVFAGDPARGIPPCTSCHGPSAIKLGAPRLTGQQADYIEHQLGAFADGTRHNDINEQMRTIAVQLTPKEMHAVAGLYAAASPQRVAKLGP